MEINPSAEKESVNSTAPADWACTFRVFRVVPFQDFLPSKARKNIIVRSTWIYTIMVDVRALNWNN